MIQDSSHIMKSTGGAPRPLVGACTVNLRENKTTQKTLFIIGKTSRRFYNQACVRCTYDGWRPSLIEALTLRFKT